MTAPLPKCNGGAERRPQLPAFCRTRRPTITVSINSLNNLRQLLVLLLLFQLCTLLLVIAGPALPRLAPVCTNSPLPPVAGVAASRAQQMPLLSKQ